MYPMIILDDEPIVLKSIQKVFKMSDYGFEIKGAFTNPEKALEAVPMIKPRLIITDVKMPQMTGLEFSIKIKEILPDAEIVILSGYDDFSFAQSAMKIGVSEYLLKPIKKADFANMLNNMKQKIEEKEGNEAYYGALQEFAKNNQIELTNTFLLNLIEDGLRDEAYCDAFCKNMELDIKDEAFALIKIFLGDMGDKGDTATITGVISAELESLLEMYGKVKPIIGNNEDLYVLIYGDESIDNYEDITDTINEYIIGKASFGYHMSAGISSIMFGLGMLYIAGYECESNRLAPDIDMKADHYELSMINSEIAIPYNEMEKLFVSISSGKKDNIRSDIEKIYGDISGFKLMDYATSISYLIYIRMNMMDPALNDSGKLMNFFQIRTQFSTVEKQKEYICQMADRLADNYSDGMQNVSSGLVNDALDYIHQHYMENISLSDVAGNIAISKNYLCDIFKKELNVTFVCYITNLRIEQAKKYLSDTDMKMYEIAEKVGFSDYSYFSQIFKRYTGQTLSAYRRINKK